MGLFNVLIGGRQYEGTLLLKDSYKCPGYAYDLWFTFANVFWYVFHF